MNSIHRYIQSTLVVLALCVCSGVGFADNAKVTILYSQMASSAMLETTAKERLVSSDFKKCWQEHGVVYGPPC